MNQKDCSRRATTLGEYQPGAGQIYLPFGPTTSDPDPYVTYWHELIHLELTETTLAGSIDRLLALRSEDISLPHSDRAEVQEVFEKWFNNSWVLQEGTATYVARIEVLAFVAYYKPERVPDLIASTRFQDLPGEYKRAVQPILEHLPTGDLDDAASNYLHGSFAKTIAKIALDACFLSTDFRSKIVDWQSLKMLLMSDNHDERYLCIYRELSTTGHVSKIFDDLCGNYGVATATDFDEKIRELARPNLGGFVDSQMLKRLLQILPT